MQGELDSHKSAQNPHNITKEVLGLGDVPNVNFQALLDTHLAASNPHNIDLSFFDVYAKAEADSRTQFYIDSVRYEFTPISNTDSAGAVGDFAYDTDNLYFKIGAIDWVKLPFSPVYIQREATQEDVDAGLATEVGEIITVNEVAVKNVSEITINNNFNITNEGDDVFQITEEGDIIQNNTTIEGNITVEGNIISNENITIDAPSTTINNLTVEGGSLTNITNVETTEFSSETIDVNDAEITNLSVSNIVNKNTNGDTSDFEYDFEINRWVTDTPVGLFNFAYVSDIPDLSNYALKSDIPTNLGGTDPDEDDGAGETDIVLDSQIGGIERGYAFTKDAGLYADDFDEPGDQEYWAYEASAILNSGLVVNIGQGSNNPFLRYNTGLNEWQIFNGTDTYIVKPYTQGEIDALLANKANVNHTHSEYALAANLPDFSTFATLEDLEGLGSTTIINEGDTIVNETIIQQGLTIDAQSGGPENGYAYTEGAGLYADDPSESGDQEYWSVEATSYGDTGLTIDIGMDPNPSMKYDTAISKWVAFDGTNSITIDSYTKSESDGRYLQSLPSHNHDERYYTKSASDGRYLQSMPTHNHDSRYYTEAEVDALLSNLQSAIEAKFYSI